MKRRVVGGFMATVSLSASVSAASYARRSDQIAAAIYRISSGDRFFRSADDISAISIAAQLQSQLSTSRQALNNSAQASSVIGVAYGGLSQIEGLLSAARQLAETAQSGSISDAQRGLLNAQFNQIREQIDAIAAGTSFNGTNLLDGSIEGDDALSFQIGVAADDAIELDIEDVSSDSLFDGQAVSLSTQDAADDAIDALDDAQELLGNILASVGGTLQGASYAGVALESGIGGLSGAYGGLADTNIATESTQLALELIHLQTASAVLAQTRELNSGLLDLVSLRTSSAPAAPKPKPKAD